MGDASAAGGREAVAGALTMEIVRLIRLVKASAQVPEGTDRSALVLLVPLLHGGPMRLRELADAKGADPSTVSRQAAQLVRAGLVSSECDPVDGRARRLALTAAGRAQCRRMLAEHSRALDELLGDWSDAKMARFAELFGEFNTRMEQLTRPRAADDPAAAGPDERVTT